MANVCMFCDEERKEWQSEPEAHLIISKSKGHTLIHGTLDDTIACKELLTLAA